MKVVEVVRPVKDDRERPHPHLKAVGTVRRPRISYLQLLMWLEATHRL